MTGRFPATVLAAASLFVAGCGASDEDKVRDAFTEATAAADDKDAEKFCGLVSKKALDQAEQSAGKTCEESLDKASLDALAKATPDPDDIEFGKVTVKDDTATVRVKGEELETKLVKEDGDWKLTR